MSKINNRQKELLDILLIEMGFNSLSFYSEKLNVSPKTITRDLKNIENLLKLYHGNILKKPGLGIKLEMSDKNKLELKYFLNEESNKRQLGSYEERRNEELHAYLLMFVDEIYIDDVVQEFFMSKSVAYNSINKIFEYQKETSNLVLYFDEAIIRKDGTEDNLRIHITNVIAKLINISLYYSTSNLSVINQFESSSFKKVVMFLIDETKKEELNRLMNQIYSVYEIKSNSLEKHWLKIFILISLFRVQSNRLIEFDYSISDRSNILIQHFNSLGLISVNEIGYILHTIEERFESHSELINTEKINSYTEDFLDLMSIVYSIDLKSTKQYTLSFKHHLRSFFEKKAFENFFPNPILMNLRKKYKDKFRIYEVLNWLLSNKHGVRMLNEDELTSLLIYIESEVTKLQKTYNSLLIFDYPSSLLNMFMNRIEVELPNLKIEIVSDLNLIDERKLNEFDFIISTLPIGFDNFQIEKLNIEIISVSPLLNDNDIQLISRFIDARTEPQEVLLEIKRILHDLQDIGTNLQIIGHDKEKLKPKIEQDFILNSVNNFHYFISKNKNENLIHMSTNDDQIIQVYISMNNWDYLLLSLKLIFIFEKSMPNQIVKVFNEVYLDKGV